MLNKKGLRLYLHSPRENYSFSLSDSGLIDRLKLKASVDKLYSKLQSEKKICLPYGGECKEEDIFFASIKELSSINHYRYINPTHCDNRLKQLKEDLYKSNTCKFATRVFGGSYESEILFGMVSYLINKYTANDLKNVNDSIGNFWHDLDSVKNLYGLMNYVAYDNPEIIDYLCSDEDNMFMQDEKCEIEENDMIEYLNKYKQLGESIDYLY